MKLAGRRDLPFPRAAVWAALMDPDVLSRTLPGCERLERTGEGTFAGTLAVAVGPVRGRFDGTLELTEVQPPEGYRMKLHGEGPSGFMTGEGTVRLEDAAAGGTAGGTVLLYDLEAQVGGRIAGVGQRLLDSSAKVIARQGLDGLERQLAARHGTAGAGTAAVAAPAEGGDRPAADVRESAGASTPGPAAGDSSAPAPGEPPGPAAPPGPTASPPAVPSAAARPAAASGPPGSGGPATADPAAPGRAAPGPAAPEPAKPEAARSEAARSEATAHRPLAPPPSQSEFAGQFLRGLWEEMVPPAARPWVVAGAVLLLALVVLLLAWLLT